MDLFSIPIVATAVAIVITWALFAIFCSLVHEGIVSVKGERGRFMKTHLQRQLFDHPNGINWGSLLYLHPSIDLLARTSTRPTSHISPKMFAEVLIEVVGKSHIVQMRIAGLEAQKKKEEKEKSDQKGKENKVNQEEHKQEKVFENPVLRNFKAATMVLKESDVIGFLKQVMASAELQTGVDGGSDDEAAVYNHLVKQIEAWYTEMEKRMSRWYQKKTRGRIFFLGAVLAVLFNIDSFELFRHFNRDPAARQVVMDYYEKNMEALDSLSLVSGEEISRDSIKKLAINFATNMDTISGNVGLKIGWSHNFIMKHENASFQIFNCEISCRHCRQSCWKELCQMLLAFLFHFPGYLLSGFAASFGAPFWFDVLKKAYTLKQKPAS